MVDVERIGPGARVWRRRPGEERHRRDAPEGDTGDETEERPEQRTPPEPDDDDDGHVDVYV